MRVARQETLPINDRDRLIRITQTGAFIKHQICKLFLVVSIIREPTKGSSRSNFSGELIILLMFVE